MRPFNCLGKNWVKSIPGSLPKFVVVRALTVVGEGATD